uniref:DNA-directed DNA polymerase n=2 Tax=Meloidogyne TaxID=189290 RepID=A0A915NVU7_9BILA
MDVLTNGNGPSELLESNSNIKLLNILERFTSSNKFALKMYKKLTNSSNQKISPTLLLQTIQFLSRTILNEIKNNKENKSLIFDNNLLDLYMQSMITSKMESVGIKLDRRKAGKMVSYILEKMVFIEGEIYKLAGERFNLDSASEVSKILFIKLQLNLPEHIISNNNCKTRKRHRKHFPTNASVLKQINHPICVKIDKWRRMANALSCLRSLLASVSSGDSRIHTHFENIGTITGRVCCFSPNLQFISKKSLFDEKTASSVRSIFVVPNGRILLAVDYSQLELRILCALSEDLELAKMLKEEDPFERISIEFGRSINSKNNEKGNLKKENNNEIVGIGREKAKQLCYAIIYGMGATTLGNELKIQTEEAQLLIDGFFKLFPKVKYWINKNIEKSKENGYSTTFFGNKHNFNWEKDKENISSQNALERRCVNFVIQASGTASELFRQAMIKVDEKLKEIPNAQLVMQLHDELLIEVDENCLEKCALTVKECMEEINLNKSTTKEETNNFFVNFPVKLSIGRDWGSLTKLEASLIL